MRDLETRRGLLRERGPMSTFQFFDAEQVNHPVTRLCRVLGVSRSGFHTWRGRPPSARATADLQLGSRISEAHEASRRTYGVPRIQAVLAREGKGVGKKRVARLVRAQGIQGVSRRRGRRSLTKANPQAPKAPDRVGRKFAADAPNQLWVTDITCIAAAEGWL